MVADGMGEGQFQWSLHGEGSIEFCWALVVEAAAALVVDDGSGVLGLGDTLADDLRSLLERIDRELDYNAAKGSTPFRQGMHDGLRFAQDAVADLLRRHGHTAEIEPRDWDA